MAGEPTEQQIMGLYAVAREEAKALAETRASLDATTKRLAVLQGAIAREAGTAIGQAAKAAVATVNEAAEAAAKVVAGETARDLRRSADRVVKVADDVERQLRGFTRTGMAAFLFMGMVIGGGGVGWLAWSSLNEKLETILETQASQAARIAPAAPKTKR